MLLLSNDGMRCDHPTHERTLLDRAVTQNALGNTLHHLCELTRSSRLNVPLSAIRKF